MKTRVSFSTIYFLNMDENPSLHIPVSGKTFTKNGFPTAIFDFLPGSSIFRVQDLLSTAFVWFHFVLRQNMKCQGWDAQLPLSRKPRNSELNQKKSAAIFSSRCCGLPEGLIYSRLLLHPPVNQHSWLEYTHFSIGNKLKYIFNPGPFSSQLCQLIPESYLFFSGVLFLFAKLQLHLEDGLPGLVSSNYGWIVSKSPRPGVNVKPLPEWPFLHGLVHGGVILTTSLLTCPGMAGILQIPNHANLGHISKHARQPLNPPSGLVSLAQWRMAIRIIFDLPSHPKRKMLRGPSCVANQWSIGALGP